jgi:hypothetical protein
MLLRDHPLMSFKGVPSWPPVWTWIDGHEKESARGEIGILKEVTLSKINPADRCFLYIEHEGSFYLGCLLIDDNAFCCQITKLLQAHYNRSLAEIGCIDLSYTF